MTRTEKNEIIDGLTEQIKASPHFYITDISTMTVEKTNQLRRICFNKGVTLKVAKNSLILKALEKSGKDCSQLFDVLSGSSSLMFCDTANTPAKLIREFRKKSEKPILKGAFVEESVYIGDSSLVSLSELKSKNELIGDVLALLQSPAKNVISGLLSGKSKLAGIVKTLSEKKEN